MSYANTRHEFIRTIGAGITVEVPVGTCDYVRFHTLPDGIVVNINGASESSFVQGETHQAEPGSGSIRHLTLKNDTAGDLAVRVIFGLGRIDVTGVAMLTGAVPLPTGAATGAKQDTQITRLNLLATEATLVDVLAALVALLAENSTEAKQDTQITRLNLLGTESTLAALLAAVATAAKQDAQTALLTTLAANVIVTGDVVTITGSTPFANCRALSVTNTGAANITVNNGAGARTIIPGDSVDWPCVGPFAKYGTITVDATGSSAVVVTTV